MYKYILFDLDGTLADTDLLVVEGFLRFYRKYKPGEKVPFRLLASFSGPTLKETFEKHFPSYNADELVKDFKAFSLPLYQTFVEIYPGTFEGLQVLKEHGIRIAVITSKMRDPSLRTLNNLGLTPYVDLLIAWDDVTKPKPDTEGIERALKFFHAEKKDTLFVGDGVGDFLAAKNAALDVAMVSWNIRGKLPNVTPTYYVSTWKELVEVILTHGEK